MSGSGGHAFHPADGHPHPTEHPSEGSGNPGRPRRQRPKATPKKRVRSLDNTEHEGSAEVENRFVILCICHRHMPTHENDMMVAISASPSLLVLERNPACVLDFPRETPLVQAERPRKRKKQAVSTPASGLSDQSISSPLSPPPNTHRELTIISHPNPLQDVPMGLRRRPQPLPQVAVTHKPLNVTPGMFRFCSPAVTHLASDPIILAKFSWQPDITIWQPPTPPHPIKNLQRTQDQLRHLPSFMDSLYKLPQNKPSEGEGDLSGPEN